MNGLMMDRPLLIKRLLWRAERIFGDKLVVSREGSGYHEYSYADFGRRVRRLAGALQALGIAPGDRVATLAWNTHRHLECYFAIPGMGAVLHTANHRLSDAQLAYTINHAGDRAVLVDPDLVPRLESIATRLPSVRSYVVLGPVSEGTTLHPVVGYEDLLAEAHSVELPELAEDTAASLCYTSGTTGDPKGVLQPSQHGPARAGLVRQGVRRDRRGGHLPGRHADVPRERLGHTVCVRAAGHDVDTARNPSGS
jgi:fatty-acyl-CoA synthase